MPEDNLSTNLENGTNTSNSNITLDKPADIFLYESQNYQSDDLILLEKLCRAGYFDGGHHLEEIMYLENIRRSQLLQVLDKFRDVLITCEHEDPAMALFYSQPLAR